MVGPRDSVIKPMDKKTFVATALRRRPFERLGKVHIFDGTNISEHEMDNAQAAIEAIAEWD